MLDSEITIEKMKSGLSKIRNRGIAAAFSYMNIVEGVGQRNPENVPGSKGIRPS